MDLNKEELQSVRESYLQITKLLLSSEHVETRYVYCLLKWAVQLGINVADIKSQDSGKTEKPNRIADKAHALYNLVYMIYLDDVVEDVELEVAIRYAEALGIETVLVGEFFKAIATSPFDGKTSNDVREEIRDYLRLYGLYEE